MSFLSTHSNHQDDVNVEISYLLLGFGGFSSFAKDTVEVCFSTGGQILSWMERK